MSQARLRQTCAKDTPPPPPHQKVYNKVGHGDFVVCWPSSAPPEHPHLDDDDDDDSREYPTPPPDCSTPRQLARAKLRARSNLVRQLPAYNRDLCQIVSGAAEVDFCGSSGGGGGGGVGVGAAAMGLSSV